jgi:hypothetical protein
VGGQVQLSARLKFYSRGGTDKFEKKENYFDIKT